MLRRIWSNRKFTHYHWEQIGTITLKSNLTIANEFEYAQIFFTQVIHWKRLWSEIMKAEKMWHFGEKTMNSFWLELMWKHVGWNKIFGLATRHSNLAPSSISYSNSIPQAMRIIWRLTGTRTAKSAQLWEFKLRTMRKPLNNYKLKSDMIQYTLWKNNSGKKMIIPSLCICC